MKLYEINAAIEGCIDMETGEIKSPDLLNDLQMERREKLANIALLAKNKAAEVKALREEETSFKRRRQAAETTLQWCRDTLARELSGEKMEDEKKRFSITYRTSKAVNLLNVTEIPDIYLKQVARESLVDKAAIKAAIENGETVPGAEIVERQNIQIR